jgi:hypothetical protein
MIYALFGTRYLPWTLTGNVGHQLSLGKLNQYGSDEEVEVEVAYFDNCVYGHDIEGHARANEAIGREGLSRRGRHGAYSS